MPLPRYGAFTCDEPVSGAWLRSTALEAARTRTVSVDLERPSGIVTLHSRMVAFFPPLRPRFAPDTSARILHHRPIRPASAPGSRSAPA
ncbi:hypothetical protein [Streptomyces sp. TSRI0107]|uniref:hypothetical protein n=1 Tax=Streptomyces sp. TSRI0107 TaxID=1703942 RepID=UPI00093DBF39|nr:hypothetical protein [Streptomyces sp. TSRI0107]OKJ71150.1 hypothetical protein AMK31_35345 [Streptomyces sp. TSRI0107]